MSFFVFDFKGELFQVPTRILAFYENNVDVHVECSTFFFPQTVK